VEVGGRDRETAKSLTEKVVEILEANPEKHYRPHIEEIQDVVEKNGGRGACQGAKAYIYTETNVRSIVNSKILYLSIPPNLRRIFPGAKSGMFWIGL
jgi:hypothetical protein